MKSRWALARLLWLVSPRLTVAVGLTTVVAGFLPPAFNVLTGMLAGAVPEALGTTWTTGEGRRVFSLLAVASGVYLSIHLMGPVRETAGAILMRRADQYLTMRVMRAVSTPRGVAHLEDPEVLDRIAQAQGAVTGSTPGAAAYYIVQIWAQRLQGATSLAIVAAWNVPVTVALLIGHVIAYRWRAWHWREVTNVIMGRTDVLRRSHYLRRLAVEPDAAKETRVFSLGPWLVERYRAAFLEGMRDIWQTRRTGGIVAVGVTLLMLAIEGGALALVVIDGIQGTVSPAAVFVFAQAIVAASNLGTFSEGHVAVEEGEMALKALAELESIGLHEKDESVDGVHRAAAGVPRHSVRFEGVTFTYAGRDQPVFDGLDLDIEVGRSLAIVGENGAGKTTLVKLLCRLYDPTSGRITADGVGLTEFDASEWQGRVAAIFQDFVHYQLSARDNVAFGALHMANHDDAVDTAGRQSGASAIVERLPASWDTVMSRQFTGGADLSGGEWQRLALARAMFAIAGGAGLLILDEPTAALDVRGEAELYERFLDLTRGTTTIVISHRFSTVRRADRIVVLEHGQVVEDGTHASLVAHGGRYAEMYNLQAARFVDDVDPAATDEVFDADEAGRRSAEPDGDGLGRSLSGAQS